MDLERLLPVRQSVTSVMTWSKSDDKVGDGVGVGFPTPEATKIAVVISELGRNIVLYTKRRPDQPDRLHGERKGSKSSRKIRGQALRMWSRS
jgi:hypothetical protein